MIEELFEMFESYLLGQGLHSRGGQIIDEALVPVPMRRNSREDTREINENRIPDVWDQNPNRWQQKDVDARWFQKNGVNHSGYKNNICINVEY